VSKPTEERKSEFFSKPRLGHVFLFAALFLGFVIPAALREIRHEEEMKKQAQEMKIRANEMKALMERFEVEALAKISNAIPASSRNGVEPSKKETHAPSYRGVVAHEFFEHAGNGEQVDAYILILEKPAVFLGDEFVKACEMTELHMTTSSRTIDLRDYVGKRVSAHGELFGEHTAWHHRKVLVSVKQLREL